MLAAKTRTIGSANIGNPAPNKDRKKELAAMAEFELMV